MPEATQELRASDALELLETGSLPGLVVTPRKLHSSQPSIAPVGLDLRASAFVRAEEDAEATLEVKLPRRRRALGRLLVGAAGALCAGILVLAVARARRPAAEADVTPPSAAAALALPVTDPAPPPVPPSAPVAPDAPAAPSTGTLRVDRPASPSRIVLDGQRLTTSPVTVACGTHQIRVGTGRLRSIVIPCGGEVAVSHP